MATAKELISIAASQIGYCESPANSNNTKYGIWYGMNYNPWCDMFVSWCANQIGALDIVGKYAYTPSHAQFFKNKGQWIDRSGIPQPGDIVFFSNAKIICHVGIVESRNGSTSITTIEGNTSSGNNANGGSVQRRTRYYGNVGSSWWIAGFGRPNYGGAATVTPVTQPTTNTSSINAIGSVQTWLNGGYNTRLDVDGSYGPKTRAGLVKALQTELNKQYKRGLDVDGSFGPKTRAAVVAIKRGASGNITKTLQGCLICRRYDTGGFDGSFGPATEKAVRSYQETHKLDKDGIVGPATWTSLLG